MPRVEPNPIEGDRFLDHFAKINDADSRQLVRVPNSTIVISENVFGVLVGEGFGSVRDHFAAIGQSQVVVVLVFMQDCRHRFKFYLFGRL